MAPVPRLDAPGADEATVDDGSKQRLHPADAWIDTVDLSAWRNDVQALGKRLKAAQGMEDVTHLNKIILWSVSPDPRASASPVRRPEPRPPRLQRSVFS